MFYGVIVTLFAYMLLRVYHIMKMRRFCIVTLQDLYLVNGSRVYCRVRRREKKKEKERAFR